MATHFITIVKKADALKKIYVINGPNLNRLGKREPDIYGVQTLADLEKLLAPLSDEFHCKFIFKQSNHEGDIIDWIHEAEDEQASGIILNPGAFTHYSYAIRDAIAAVNTPVIEVHISNVHSRESFRHTSVISAVSKGQIVGFGFYGYKMAALAFLEQLERQVKK